uniref:Uncharacterized protein n=1 Tax=Colobus angolensis palliatus TaxID=336983 RepID=A0A2K5JVW2_COLAP
MSSMVALPTGDRLGQWRGAGEGQGAGLPQEDARAAPVRLQQRGGAYPKATAQNPLPGTRRQSTCWYLKMCSLYYTQN